jgi:hypothetical protein
MTVTNEGDADVFSMWCICHAGNFSIVVVRGTCQVMEGAYSGRPPPPPPHSYLNAYYVT